MIVYQLCPKCEGQGTVSKPPWVDGDVYEWIDSSAGGYVCNVCGGAKVMPTPNELLSPDSQYMLVARA